MMLSHLMQSIVRHCGDSVTYSILTIHNLTSVSRCCYCRHPSAVHRPSFSNVSCFLLLIGRSVLGAISRPQFTKLIHRLAHTDPWSVRPGPCRGQDGMRDVFLRSSFVSWQSTRNNESQDLDWCLPTTPFIAAMTALKQVIAGSIQANHKRPILTNNTQYIFLRYGKMIAL